MKIVSSKSNRTTFWRVLLLAAAATALVSATQLKGIAAGGLNEYDVKAAFLADFGRFVNWPKNQKSDPAPSFPICVLGIDPFGQRLDRAAAGQQINDGNVIVRRISMPQQTAGCRVLFISASESGSLDAALATLSHAAILTVSDMPQFIEHGGMVGFVVRDSRVRFEVNLDAVKAVGLSLSSQLIKVAALVKASGAKDETGG